ncbi:hypothetical protein C8F01DRAFT_1234893, partial [Mycena amicta]
MYPFISLIEFPLSHSPYLRLQSASLCDPFEERAAALSRRRRRRLLANSHDGGEEHGWTAGVSMDDGAECQWLTTPCLPSQRSRQHACRIHSDIGAAAPSRKSTGHGRSTDQRRGKRPRGSSFADGLASRSSITSHYSKTPSSISKFKPLSKHADPPASLNPASLSSPPTLSKLSCSPRAKLDSWADPRYKHHKGRSTNEPAGRAWVRRSVAC